MPAFSYSPGANSQSSTQSGPIGSSGYGVPLRGYEPIITVIATKTLAITDSGTVQNCTNAAAAVITIPLNSAEPFPIGCRIIVRKTTSQTVTISWPSGVTVLNSTGTTLTVTGVTSSTILRKTASDGWIAFPDLPESAIGGALRVAVDAPTAKSTIGLSAVTNVPLAEPRASTIRIGSAAGGANTSGTDWTATGANAGGVNATGSYWTATGANAGGVNATGSYWTAVGSNAGGVNATGSYWTAVGSNAGAACTNGFWTAIGVNAGAACTGISWTAIGVDSSLDVTTGSYNTTIGYNTGRGITTGSGNTIIGAGVTGLAATLANNVILASGDGVIKLQIDSTGLATLPISPTYSDNSNLVATTAHVKNVLLNSPSITLTVLKWISGAFLGSLNWTPTANRTIVLPDNSGTIQLDAMPTAIYRAVVAISATKTLALADLGTYQYCTNTAAITLSIPLNSGAAFAIGSEIEIKKGGAGTLSIAVISGVTLLGDGGSTVTTPFTLTKGATLKKVASDSWILEGA